jgi:NTP pyrophosphatase (non-canonical NTP hydrolase)
VEASVSREPEERTLVHKLEKRMLHKLRKNQHKSHWREEPVDWLLMRLKEEVAELEQAVMCEPGESIWNEAADVANIAAMVADVCTFAGGHADG